MEKSSKGKKRAVVSKKPPKRKVRCLMINFQATDDEYMALLRLVISNCPVAHTATVTEVNPGIWNTGKHTFGEVIQGGKKD